MFIYSGVLFSLLGKSVWGAAGGQLGWTCLGKGTTELHLVGLLPGKEARELDTRLIRYSQETYPKLCSNVAPDSRGLPEDTDAFIYVTRRIFLLTDRPGKA